MPSSGRSTVLRQVSQWPRVLLARASTYLRALRLIWSVAPGEVAFIAVVLLVRGLIPPLSVWLVKSIVDAVSIGSDPRWATLLVVLWAATSLVSQLLYQGTQIVQGNLNELLGGHVELMLLRKANALPDLAPFEDAAFYDRLQVLTREAAYRPMNLMVTTSSFIQGTLSSTGMLVLAASLAWWVPVLLVVATFPLSYTWSRLQRQSWEIVRRQNPLTRAMRYFASLATTITNAKEVRLFGLGRYFEKRYQSAFEALHHEASRARARQARAPVAATMLFVVVNGFVLWWGVSQVLGGHLGPGSVVLLLQALEFLLGSLGSIATMSGLLGGHLLVFQEFFDFLDYRSAMRVGCPGATVRRPLTKGITFDTVSFGYPNGKAALRGVSFTIHPGERVALVGENGAGKTTLVKLLCRLYDPTSGTIRVDGVDLRDLDLESWRAGIGAVFQDFGRYQLTVAENIALGDLSALSDEARVGQAARESGFARHAEALPKGYATQIGAEFGGIDLSGGQWQSLGLARALIRESEILILDEPTAALDARAEYELFSQFTDLSRGKTTLLVTHRLGSVRMADRIIVLDKGELVEQGTHDGLLRQGGTYATLFRMQAEQYRVSDG